MHIKAIKFNICIFCCSFKRPLYIGVYGHPSREFSIYHLDIVFRNRDSDIICLEEESDFGNFEDNDIDVSSFPRIHWGR